MYKELIIDTCIEYGLPLKQAAYVLATAYWETAKTFEPVREAFYLGKKANSYRKKLRYYPYYGRGFVQLTWEANYKRAGEKFGKNFLTNPDEVMEPNIAAEILVVGSKEGWFTGKKLGDYITDDGADYINARRVINGLDKASDIALLAKEFELELGADKDRYKFKSTQKPVQPVPKPSGTTAPEKAKRPWWSFLIDFIVGLFK
jgi:hypothetical protein